MFECPIHSSNIFKVNIVNINNFKKPTKLSVKTLSF